MRITVRALVGLLFSFLGISTALAAAADIGDRPMALLPLPDPTAERVVLRGAALRTASAVLAGRGIDGVAAQPLVDDAGRELAWKLVRRHVDDEGGIHAFYRQHLLGNGLDAEVYGSEVGAHYTADNALRWVSGTQYREVNVANSGVSLDRDGAVEAAAYRLMARNQVRVRHLSEMSADLRKRAVDAAKLMLVERGGVFRYHYFVVVSDIHDAGYQVVLDADTEAIVAVTETNPGNNCTPTAPVSAVSATGTPVRTGLPARALKANPAADKPAPFTHEGYWLATPSKVVYQQTSGNGGLWMCNPNLSYSWTIFPVRTENGVPVYKEWADQPAWRGSAAGDALHHTNLTMAALNAMGRKGWDGNYGEARIIIESRAPFQDSAQYNQNLTSIAPANAVMLGRPLRMYPASSSLDWVAHEFGHGVVHTSADFPYTGVGAELNEGFADVIGHLVEMRSHPGGTGLEKFDWLMHEDAAVSGYARGAVDDGASHTWVGPVTYNGTNFYTFNDLLHKDDTPTTSTTIHSHANKLSVVYRLLTMGGTNPVCTRLPNLSGCGTTVDGLGSTKASKILFNALQFYLTSFATWDSLADLVAYAAFNEYDKCWADPFWNASIEQQAVFDAFTAIGHPGSGRLYECF